MDSYDALIVISFGGPEGPDDVIPFLENVLRGKNVPRERMLEVADHYQHFGGVSPINQQNRELIAALQRELEQGPRLPIYWGNRNWHPLLPDTVRRMKEDGVRRALAFVTSAYSSYSSCRQYLENIADARRQVDADSLQIDKIRAFFNHPGFIEAVSDRVREAFQAMGPERRASAEIIFSAHSIPVAMAAGCRYEEQLRETCRLVSERLEHPRWKLVYQSRSGPPSQPWLEPDICDALRALHAETDVRDVVVSPVGFVSDHIEVLFDIDTEARQLCDELGIGMVRAATPGTHPRFIRMIRELIDERVSGRPDRPTCGSLGPVADVCPDDCCPSGRPPGSGPSS